MDLNLRALMGNPIRVWTIDDWHRIDNNASTRLWLDHSISTWSVTDTQWHMNEYSAITCNAQYTIASTLFSQFLREQWTQFNALQVP
eukprot:3458920-Amphidinium_carterae.1